MSGKILFNILCLSLALIEIQAFVRQPEQRNHGFAQPSVEQELEKDNQEVERHHHHRHHHHKHHQRMEEHITPHMMAHRGHMGPHPPAHHMMAQLWPLFKAMLNKKYSKNEGMTASDDSKLDTESKATAHVKSKFQTKITETNIINSGPNKSQTYVKVTDQKAESDAVLQFNSNMDVISDKTLKAKSDVESTPMKGQNVLVESDLPKMAMHKHDRKPHHLNRLKRQAEAGGGAPAEGDPAKGAGGKGGKGGKGKDFMKQVGEKIAKVGAVIKEAVNKIGDALGIGEKAKGKGAKKTEPAADSVKE